MKIFLFVVLLIASPVACSRSTDKDTREALKDIKEREEIDSDGTRVIHQTIDAKQEHLEDYLELLKSRDRKVRLKAIRLLGDLDDCEEAQDALIKILETGTNAERGTAAGGLRIKKAVPALIKALKDPLGGVRSNATQSLGCIGDDSTIEPLKRMLTDQDKTVRLVAAKALFRLGDDSGLPVIVESLDDNDARVQQRARMAVAEIEYYRRVRAGKDKDVEVVTALPLEEAKEIVRGWNKPSGQ